MSIQITPSQQLEIHFLGSYVKKHTTVLVLNEWTFVGSTFSFIRVNGKSIAEVTSDIIVGTNSLTFAASTESVSKLPDPGPSAFFQIGGSPSFIGEISSINFYNPGAVIAPRKDNFIDTYLYFL